MQFFTIPVLALFAAGTLAMPNNLESSHSLEARVDCGQILPACNGGSVVGQTNCRCSGQAETCDLWSCPGSSPNVMVCGQRGTGCVWI
ncbi:signal peptide-containing protein [Diaporthe amygdali]|uniref:signal peptide-containing protein n=1 Tax=Phomopsis amygdali TaxID=1214568 RepID=UPI0022FDB8D4|nr:signal peptide-containing protein [Diaporthe amygdali]KAJ0103945.1 signal peptide-containing protein [Diaporthe amygdali]